MKIAITEDQVIRLKRKLNKEILKEDFLDDLIKKGGEYVNKGIDVAKDFISGLDVPVEKKGTDEAGKADFVSSDPDKFFEILDSVDEKIVQQKYGQMNRQQKVEAVQIGLQLLGYELKRFGTDGLFGPETAAAVNKFKADKNIQDDDTSFDLHESTLIAPIPIVGNIRHGFSEKRGNRIHGGIDIPAKVGTQIQSIADGKVIAAGALDSRCGDGISISHADGFISSYCHLSRVSVSVGDSVEQGNVIGLTGGAVGASGSGNSKGPHLHLTLKKDGQRVDPMQYFGSSIGTYYDDGKSGSMVGGATITPEMVKELSTELKAENITKEDLEKYVDKAVTTGGSAEFTDLDLSNNSDVDAYEKICDNFINQRDPGARVTGAMMADAAVKSFRTYGKYVPPELALAQLTLEGGIGSAPNSRPNKTNNPFNVGNTETSSKHFPSVEAGVEAYYNLIARRYLVRGKTAADLVNDFKNDQGNNYATAGTYEAGLKDLISSIRKRNENVYASLAQRKSENITESLLLEADKRQAIKNALGYSDAWADAFHRMSDKLSIWIASTLLNKMIELYGDQAPTYEPGPGDNKKEFIINMLNDSEPSGDNWRSFNEYKDKYEYILHWIRAPRREQLNIRDLSFDAAYQMAEEWHESLQARKQSNYQETGDVFIDYRNADGVGYYWVHLNKNYCDDEADRMGHCARSRTGQLISFRRINDFGEGESYLTVDYRPGGVLGDFHRHGNKKPTSRFHRQIVDFLLNTRYPVSSLTKDGVHRYEDNFKLSDLSPADLKRVYAGNTSLRFDINNENTWPEIIDAIISNEVNFVQYPAGIKLKLFKKSKSLKKDDELLPFFTDEIIMGIVQNVDELANTEKTIFMENFGYKMVELMKSNLDRKFGVSPEEAKSAFIDSLRGISQDLFDQYQSLCPYIDYGFKKFDDASRIEIIGSRGIKRSLFTCTDTVPFLSRYVDNTPIDVNGNISVKTEEGLWGLIKQNGETILHPRFTAIAPNPIDRGKTYMVRNTIGEFYKLNPVDMSTVKLEKKR
jgi:murein DD-endopeptidase MepM/ murein hydrolase activator NlpD